MPLFCIDIVTQMHQNWNDFKFIGGGVSTENLVILSYIQGVWGGSEHFVNGLFEVFA